MPFLWEPRNGYLWCKYIVYSIHYTCMPNSASVSNNNHSLYLRMYCYFTLKYPKEDLLSSWKTANLSCLFCWFLCRIANISFVTSLHFSGGLLNQPVGLVSSPKTFPCADVTRCPLRAAVYLITTAYGLKNEDDVTCRLPEKKLKIRTRKIVIISPKLEQGGFRVMPAKGAGELANSCDEYTFLNSIFSLISLKTTKFIIRHLIYLLFRFSRLNSTNSIYL